MIMGSKKTSEGDCFSYTLLKTLFAKVVLGSMGLAIRRKGQSRKRAPDGLDCEVLRSCWELGLHDEVRKRGSSGS
jgi:hypothetical protein